MNAFGSPARAGARAGLIEAVEEVRGQMCIATQKKKNNDPLAIMAFRDTQIFTGPCVKTGRIQKLRLNFLVAGGGFEGERPVSTSRNLVGSVHDSSHFSE
jgi:hypothetical protein